MTPTGSKDRRHTKLGHISRITMMPVISVAGDQGPPLFVMKECSMPFRTSFKGGVQQIETTLCNMPRHVVLAMREENDGVDRKKCFILYL